VLDARVRLGEATLAGVEFQRFDEPY
jgi:hypothetical protein